MKAVILAGGLGTRISEESHLKPKPMIEIGSLPILVHIMNIYSSYGVNDFIICAGYKSYFIKEYFNNFMLHNSDCFFDLELNALELVNSNQHNWKISVIDTGINTMTGGRVKRIKDHIDDEHFFMTYGDGVSDVNIQALKEFHLQHGGIGTVTAVNPPARYGALEIDGSKIAAFREKNQSDESKINGGFFVLNKEIFDYIEGDETFFEQEPLETLAKNGELHAFVHNGFWASMDTLRDKEHLNSLIASGEAPWIRK
jgi:glucose-1-phosphate cytidylyltransferase